MNGGSLRLPLVHVEYVDRVLQPFKAGLVFFLTEDRRSESNEVDGSLNVGTVISVGVDSYDHFSRRLGML
jgi:hypothetical protein